jgi:quinol monooxygenase YgiN
MSTNTNTDSTPSLSLHVSITVAPENVAAFFEALRPAYEGVIAEPECTFFQVFQNPEEPGVIKFVEDWNVTKEWFMTVGGYSCLMIY